MILKGAAADNSAIKESIESNNSKTAELKVYNKPAENLALGKYVTVSSVESLDYVGDNAVDGDYGTRWSSKFSDPQYIIIDLGSVQKFNTIRIVWETAYGKDYVIEVSDDDSNWNQIVKQTSGNGNIEKWSVDASARYIKLTGTKRGTQYGYSIYEFEVYNDLTTKIAKEDFDLSANYSLSDNYPNPFNPETVIEYSINKPSNIELKVFDVLGQEIATLVNRHLPAGKYKTTFSAQKYSLSSGIYFYRIKTAGYSMVKKMILLK